MARKKKFEEGTAEAFRQKKDLTKITFEDANAMMAELDESYKKYKKKWDEATTKEEKQNIEIKYLDENAKDIERIKYVAARYWDLLPGLRDVIDDVYFNIKYTQMVDKRETIIEKNKNRGKG